MAYSKVGIANMAIQRLGAKSSITVWGDGVNGAKVRNVWEYVLNEVLETVKPKFATSRVQLAKSSTDPANTDVYECAYPFPSDYMTLAEGTADDPPVWPKSAAPYAIETLSDGTLCLMSNYDTTQASYGIFLTYVKKVTDPTKFTALFVNALVFRLAAELAYTITEGQGKFETMMTLYDKARQRAQALDNKQAYLAKETSNTDWECAGR